MYTKYYFKHVNSGIFANLGCISWNILEFTFSKIRHFCLFLMNWGSFEALKQWLFVNNGHQTSAKGLAVIEEFHCIYICFHLTGWYTSFLTTSCNLNYCTPHRMDMEKMYFREHFSVVRKGVIFNNFKSLFKLPQKVFIFKTESQWKGVIIRTENDDGFNLH